MGFFERTKKKQLEHEKEVSKIRRFAYIEGSMKSVAYVRKVTNFIARLYIKLSPLYPDFYRLRKICYSYSLYPFTTQKYF